MSSESTFKGVKTLREQFEQIAQQQAFERERSNSRSAKGWNSGKKQKSSVSVISNASFVSEHAPASHAVPSTIIEEGLAKPSEIVQDKRTGNREFRIETEQTDSARTESIQSARSNQVESPSPDSSANRTESTESSATTNKLSEIRRKISEARSTYADALKTSAASGVSTPSSTNAQALSLNIQSIISRIQTNIPKTGPQSASISTASSRTPVQTPLSSGVTDLKSIQKNLGDLRSRIDAFKTEIKNDTMRKNTSSESMIQHKVLSRRATLERNISSHTRDSSIESVPFPTSNAYEALSKASDETRSTSTKLVIQTSTTNDQHSETFTPVHELEMVVVDDTPAQTPYDLKPNPLVSALMEPNHASDSNESIPAGPVPLAESPAKLNPKPRRLTRSRSASGASEKKASKKSARKRSSDASHSQEKTLSEPKVEHEPKHVLNSKKKKKSLSKGKSEEEQNSSKDSGVATTTLDRDLPHKKPLHIPRRPGGPPNRRRTSSTPRSASQIEFIAALFDAISAERIDAQAPPKSPEEDDKPVWMQRGLISDDAIPQAQSGNGETTPNVHMEEDQQDVSGQVEQIQLQENVTQSQQEIREEEQSTSTQPQQKEVVQEKQQEQTKSQQTEQKEGSQQKEDSQQVNEARPEAQTEVQSITQQEPKTDSPSDSANSIIDEILNMVQRDANETTVIAPVENKEETSNSQQHLETQPAVEPVTALPAVQEEQKATESSTVSAPAIKEASPVEETREKDSKKDIKNRLSTLLMKGPMMPLRQPTLPDPVEPVQEQPSEETKKESDVKKDDDKENEKIVPSSVKSAKDASFANKMMAGLMRNTLRLGGSTLKRSGNSENEVSTTSPQNQSKEEDLTINTNAGKKSRPTLPKFDQANEQNSSPSTPDSAEGDNDSRLKRVSRPTMKGSRRHKVNSPVKKRPGLETFDVNMDVDV